MRTNEELAILAKERDKGAMAELWEQVYWLIHKLLGKYYPLLRHEPLSRIYSP